MKWIRATTYFSVERNEQHPGIRTHHPQLFSFNIKAIIKSAYKQADMSREAFPYPRVLVDIPILNLHEGDLVDIEIEKIFPGEQANHIDYSILQTGVYGPLPNNEYVYITDETIDIEKSPRKDIPVLPDEWIIPILENQLIVHEE